MYYVPCAAFGARLHRGTSTFLLAKTLHPSDRLPKNIAPRLRRRKECVWGAQKATSPE